MPRVLVAGIGNIFLGDDGFGVEVVKRLREAAPAAGVDVVDFGIRGVHLAYELADGRYDAAILVDAVPRGGAPGTLYVLEPDAVSADVHPDVADAHNLTPAAVLAWLERIGGTSTKLTIVGCEPGSIEEFMDMSPAVTAAVDDAVRTVRDLIAAEGAGSPCV